MKNVIITLKVKKQVVEYFQKNDENSSKTIAEHFGITTQQVNVILDNYFKTIKPKK